MRIAIATIEQAGDGWLPYPLDSFTHPDDIRETVHTILAREGRPGEPDLRIVTMNRTLLDMVTSTEVKNAGPLYYEDVVIWDGEKLSPLLDHYSKEWLSQFPLGDLVDRGELDPWRSQ